MDTIGRNGNNIANIPNIKSNILFHLNNYYKPKIMFILQVSLKLFQLLLSIFNHLLGGFFVIVEAGFEREGLCFFVEKVHGS